MPTPGNALNISSPGIVVFDGTNSFSEIVPAASSVLVTSAGSVPSLSQTLPSAVQANITQVGTISSGTWNGTAIVGQYGGTGVANTGKTITLGGSLTTSGAFDSTFTMTGTTSVTFPTSGTLATTASIPSLPLSLANGGTAASLTASNGGIVYSAASAFAVLSGTATAGQIIRSGSSAAPSWSTATYPATAGTSGNVLTSDGTNWLSSAPSTSIVTINGSSGSVTGSTITWSPGTTGLTYTGSSSTMTVAGTLALANGGTNASLTASNGGIFYSTATAGAILAGTATANKVLMSGSSAAPTWSTPTFPNASATSGKIIISDGTNWIASTPTYPSTAGTSGNVLTSNGTNWTSAALSAIVTINGDTSSITGSTVTIKTNTSTGLGGSTKCVCSGTTMTITASDSAANTYLGTTVGSFGVGAANTVVGNSNCATSMGGAGNTGMGQGVFRTTASGDYNVAIGAEGMISSNGGSYNCTLGGLAGRNFSSTESSNIMINNQGTVGDNNIMRVGAGTGTGTQQINKAFIHGVRGITTVNADAVAVLVDSAGQFGTVSSSERFKQDIVDMKDESSSIMKLRPVSFTFKENGRHGLGLIAEEVQEVFPYLCALDQEGKPFSVKYHELPAMLLNEIQKLNARIAALEEK